MMVPSTRSLRRLLPLLLLAMPLAACGARGPSAGQEPGTGPRTVRLDRSADGTAEALHVGDHLIVDLGTVPNGRWNLTGYPQDALALVSSAPDEGRFEFRARATGVGQILAVTRPGCGPAAAPACPSPGDQGPVDAVGGAFPPRPFSVRVTVS